MRKRTMMVVVLVLLLASFPLTVVAEEGPQPGDVIFHETFDGAFNDHDQRVANGWEPWNMPSLCHCESSDCKCHDLEFKQSNPLNHYPRRAHGGSGNAQQWFSFWSGHYGGVKHTLELPAGAKVRVGAWGMAWSVNEDNPEGDSGVTRLRLGVDPNGGTDPAANVVWGDLYAGNGQVPNAWVELPPVEVVVGDTGRLTIFASSDPQYGNKHNDLYLDDVYVVYLEDPSPTIPATLPTAAPAAPAGGGRAAEPAPAPDPVLEGLTSDEPLAPAQAGGAVEWIGGGLTLVLLSLVIVTARRRWICN